VTPSVSTERILAEKALRKTCGQQCVDWAVGMLERGLDTPHLLRLAAMLPPHNHFELANLRDRALDELTITDISQSEAITAYAKDILRTALENATNIIDAVAEVSQLCIASDYHRPIFDFFLLDNAYDELQSQMVQWYWDGATAENIVSLMRQRAEEFIGQS
jgi:hypothetical protein